MGRDATVDADRFGVAMDELFGDILSSVGAASVKGVRAGARESAKVWRKDAREAIGTHEYVRHGKTVTSGAYARSIGSHMVDQSQDHPLAEAGSRSLAGLTHLLVNGHARVGGGRVNPVFGLDDALVAGAEAAVDATVEALREEFR